MVYLNEWTQIKQGWLKEHEKASRCNGKKKKQEMGKEREEKKRKASPGNYWTRLGSWGNLSGTHRSHWWGCGRQDHMERGLWLCSLKLVTRLLQSPWAECEMRLARPNVLHMHHLCHKTNLINVNYVAAIIRRGPAAQKRITTCVHILAQAERSVLGAARIPHQTERTS